MRRALSILFLIVPFAFALIRAVTTGSDFRYIWMALASFIVATAVIAIGKERSRESNVSVALAGMTFLVSALVAASTGYLLGARSAVGVWIVAIAFAFCWAAGYALRSPSPPRAL